MGTKPPTSPFRLRTGTIFHPFYSLSKKPETTAKRYKNGDHLLGVSRSIKGLVEIHDEDILIYCVSQIMANYGEVEG